MITKTMIILSACCFMAYWSYAQTVKVVGTKFPEIKSHSLAGNEVSLPEKCAGKITLITVAFIREGQPYIDSWAEPFLDTYGGRDGFDYYEVPMMSDQRPEVKDYIDSGMRAGIDQQMHPNVVTFYGDFGRYRSELEMPDIRLGYAFLIDETGVIQFRGEGKMSEKDWKNLKMMINSLKTQ